MIAAFGMVDEIEPGVIAIAAAALQGIHLTRLLPDGSGKAVFDDPNENAKRMTGLSTGWPIVLASPNDLVGLTIAEGIENGLSAHQVSGLGAWAAGCASRLPELADKVPDYIESATLMIDDDDDGRWFAGELANRLMARGIEVRKAST
jgi:hypothetical protein